MPNKLLYSVLLGLSLLLSACSSPQPTSRYSVNTSYEAVSHSSRVRHLVIHYTSSSFENALKTLTQGDVSSHYLITDAPEPEIYRLVDESRRAWHAGLSEWYGQPDLNTSSIGIELVNEGRSDTHEWASYAPAQIEALIALLQDLVAQHQIAPEHIVGHSDIAPQRKVDPGPLFPWEQLAQAGLGRWFDPATAQYFSDYYAAEGLPSPLSTQVLLQNLGYGIATDGRWDASSKNVLIAFQMHYRPALYDGLLDAETAGILRALQPTTPNLRDHSPSQP